MSQSISEITHALKMEAVEKTYYQQKYCNEQDCELLASKREIQGTVGHRTGKTHLWCGVLHKHSTTLPYNSKTGELEDCPAVKMIFNIVEKS